MVIKSVVLWRNQAIDYACHEIHNTTRSSPLLVALKRMDIVDPQVRSRIMSRVRGKNTKPELTIRRGLHARGFRFRLHRRDLPGAPDIVLPKHQAVILVHGCFWHGHDCHLFRWPATRQDWWRAKLEGNRCRDQQNREALIRRGWRVLEIWECALKGKMRLSEDIVLERTVAWLGSDCIQKAIQGQSS